jgi:hypothetical protein
VQPSAPTPRRRPELWAAFAGRHGEALEVLRDGDRRMLAEVLRALAVSPDRLAPAIDLDA